MIIYDQRGVPQSVASLDELAIVEKSLIGILGMEYDLSGYFSANDKKINSMALFQIECAGLITTMELDKLKCAQQMIDEHKTDFCTLEISNRDIHFLNAIRHWIDKKFIEAHAEFQFILSKYPRDILTLYVSHALEFYMGWPKQMKKTIEEISSSWSNRDPLYGYFKGIESFCLEENNLLNEAEHSATEALTINKMDIYAIHTMCHCFYETGQYISGIDWMEQRLSNWKDNTFMRIHVWWHYALFKFYNMEIDQVYEIYHNEIRRKNSLFGLEDLDAVALLWRMKLISKDKLSDWKKLLPYWENYPKNSFYWFNDWHAFLVFLANGRNDLADELIKNSINKNCNVYNKKMLANIFDGIKFFIESNYSEAYHSLSVILCANTFFGGSNAQRDLLEMTAIAAAINAGHFSEAENLIHSGRSLQHSSPLKNHFFSQILNKGYSHGIH